MKTVLPPLPSDADLRRLVHFSSQDGRIWLAGQRMVLLHASALGSLRRELIQTIGADQTRRLLMRTGYAAGQSDARLAKEVRSQANLFDMFAVGPQLHMLEGAVQVTPEIHEVDTDTGHFLGVYRWDHSWEVETHVRDFGPQEHPVCWMLMGYASGYTTEFFGRPIMFKEMACSACGAPSCRIEGRPLANWPDAEQIQKDYSSSSILSELQDLQKQVEVLRQVQPTQDESGPLLGKSKPFVSAVDLLRKASSTQVSVLLTGETGVGKERFARALHTMSSRADKPFVAINCAALPPDLIESELFGAEKGAYTGATSAREGRFERAHGGTLMLDELGELPLPVQAKLLRVLQDGMVERLGGSQARHVDVRLVAATNVDLNAAVAAGTFRRDLLYRLNVYPIRIPSLRERSQDIDLLAQHLLKKFCDKHQRNVAGITDQALDLMRQYDWPGNVRELENLIERGVILTGPGELISAEKLFPGMPQIDQPGVATTLAMNGHLAIKESEKSAALLDNLMAQNMGIEDLEKQLIKEAVARHKGNLSAAARALGLTRPQLSYRLQKIN